MWSFFSASFFLFYMSLQKKAIALATQMHMGQTRQTGEPYINHCLRVMQTMAQYTSDDEILATAVLHDICEDTNMSLPNLSDEFSPRVSFLVNALTKNKKYIRSKDYTPLYRIKLYINRFSKGAFSDPWIMFIKMADQIDNAATFHVFEEEKQKRKKNEIKKMFFPVYTKILESQPQKMHDIYTKLEKKLFELIDE